MVRRRRPSPAEERAVRLPRAALGPRTQPKETSREPPAASGRRLALALVAVALAGLGLATTALATTAPSARHRGTQPLVVRGESTVVDGPCGPAGCRLQFADGAFRGTLGTGAYTGRIDLDLARIVSNGEGGVCAPIRGTVVLGAGSPDRLALAVFGDHDRMTLIGRISL